MSVIDDRLAATATHQHALLTRPQVFAAGGNDGTIHRRIRSGRWERVLPGVYAIAGVPWTHRRRLCALLLSLDESAQVSHRAAAKVLAVGGSGVPPYEFTVGADRGPRQHPSPPHPGPDEPEVIIHESVDLHLDAPVHVDGLRVTSPNRLAVDLGSVVPPDTYRMTVNRLRSDHGLDWLDLEREYRRHSVQGRNGCGALRDLLDLHHESQGVPDEYVEMLTADLIASAGLPDPVHQFAIQRRDGKMAYFDLAYPDLRIGIETEGRIHLEEVVNRKDHQRRNQLLIGGWWVLHFTYFEITRQPEMVLRVIREAIEERAGLLPRI